MEQKIFECWAIVELMGHIKIGGFVTEEELFGSKVGRIDIHTFDGLVVTQYFGGSGLYRLTPTTEEVAKAISQHTPAPIHHWELKLPASLEAEE